jgi:uncharacterized protein (UPF0261 family)
MTLGTIRDRLLALVETTRDMGGSEVSMGSLCSATVAEAIAAAILPTESPGRWGSVSEEGTYYLGASGVIDGVRIWASFSRPATDADRAAHEARRVEHEAYMARARAAAGVPAAQL